MLNLIHPLTDSSVCYQDKFVAVEFMFIPVKKPTCFDVIIIMPHFEEERTYGFAHVGLSVRNLFVSGQ